MIHLINLLTQNNTECQSRKKWECPFHYFSPQAAAGEDLSHLPMEHRGGDILLRESKGPIAQVGYNIKVSFHHFCPNSDVIICSVQFQSPILCPPGPTTTTWRIQTPSCARRWCLASQGLWRRPAPDPGHPGHQPYRHLQPIDSVTQVQCEKTSIRVNIKFDRPFYGMVFSKGFYSDPNCVHLASGSGTITASFEIFLNSCGMSSSGNTETYGQPNPAGSYVENTIIIQYDALVQEVWDQARKLRCTWYDYYEKSVTFRPFQVRNLMGSKSRNVC